MLESIPDTSTTKGLLDAGTDDARAELAMYDDAMRREHEEPIQREPSSGSGLKRSPADDEALRRADAEAEKVLKRAWVFEVRRAATRTSATSAQEFKETLDTETGTSSSAAARMVPAGAVLAKTRETLQALTVSALQQTHATIHRAETMAGGSYQGQNDMIVTTREQARKK